MKHKMRKSPTANNGPLKSLSVQNRSTWTCAQSRGYGLISRVTRTEADEERSSEEKGGGTNSMVSNTDSNTNRQILLTTTAELLNN